LAVTRKSSGGDRESSEKRDRERKEKKKGLVRGNGETTSRCGKVVV